MPIQSTRRPADTSREANVDDVVTLIYTAAGGGLVSVVGQSMGLRTPRWSAVVAVLSDR